LRTAGGTAGAVFSPVNAVIGETVEKPVTQLTGSPEIGARAGVVANAVAGAIVLASAVRGDGREKRERPPALPNFDAYYHRPSYHERGTAWMAGPRRWN
jgi:hypothetical protein